MKYIKTVLNQTYLRLSDDECEKLLAGIVSDDVNVDALLCVDDFSGDFYDTIKNDISDDDESVDIAGLVILARNSRKGVTGSAKIRKNSLISHDTRDHAAAFAKFMGLDHVKVYRCGKIEEIAL